MTDGRRGAGLLYEATYPSEAEAVGEIRHGARAAAAAAGAGAELVDAVALAVSEAATNVVLHAYRESSEPGSVRVAVRRAGADALEVTIADDGLGMRPRTDSPGLGLGLPLIATLSDSFDIRDEGEQGTELCMRFRLNGVT